jgi:hypothetical protein
MRLLATNADVDRDVAPDALLLVITDPPDLGTACMFALALRGSAREARLTATTPQAVCTNNANLHETRPSALRVWRATLEAARRAR